MTTKDELQAQLEEALQRSRAQLDTIQRYQAKIKELEQNLNVTKQQLAGAHSDIQTIERLKNEQIDWQRRMIAILSGAEKPGQTVGSTNFTSTSYYQ